MSTNRNQKRLNTCYMCPEIAISREHVPPKCFFPETKDLPPEYNYRKHLITVPACNKHNVEKSGDDFYLFIVVLSLGGNLPAQRQFSTKAMRAINRDRTLLDLFEDPRPALYNWQQTMAYTVDKARFDRGIEYLARALYYHNSGRKWPYEFIILSPKIISTGGENPIELNYNIKILDKDAATLLRDRPRYGGNPEIFTYKYYVDENHQNLVIRMVFYNSTSILAISSNP